MFLPLWFTTSKAGNTLNRQKIKVLLKNCDLNLFTFYLSMLSNLLSRQKWKIIAEQPQLPFVEPFLHSQSKMISHYATDGTFEHNMSNAILDRQLNLETASYFLKQISTYPTYLPAILRSLLSVESACAFFDFLAFFLINIECRCRYSSLLSFVLFQLTILDYSVETQEKLRTILIPIRGL